MRRTRAADAALADKADSQAALDALKADTAKKTPGLFSPLKIIEAVQGALDLPFDEALALERQLFLQCLGSPQRAGLIHALFAEREVAKSPETRNAKPRAIASVGVIGGGTMGAGIAVAVLNAGLPVTMVERDDASIARGRANVEKVYDGLVAKGRMTPDAFSNEEIMRRYLAAMVNEGARVVAEGIALRPLDVDVTLVHGYGFPRFRGGPMKYADMVGLPRILADIQEFAREDPLFWQPAALLLRLIEEGRNFDSLNKP